MTTSYRRRSFMFNLPDETVKQEIFLCHVCGIEYPKDTLMEGLCPKDSNITTTEYDALMTGVYYDKAKLWAMEVAFLDAHK